jgi:hypothetical protein
MHTKMFGFWQTRGKVKRKFGIMGFIGPQENSHYEKLWMWKFHYLATRALKQLIYNYPMEIWKNKKIKFHVKNL